MSSAVRPLRAASNSLRSRPRRRVSSRPPQIARAPQTHDAPSLDAPLNALNGIPTAPELALKSTIYKAELQIADMDRHYYADHALTIARHPSETDERMMVRLVAFALSAGERLEFCKGLSDTDEPDLWQKDLTGAIETWIEVGQPDERRIAKASARAGEVIVIAYGGRTSDVWWQGLRGKIERFGNVRVLSLAEGVGDALARLAQRSMRLQVTVQEGSAWISSAEADPVAMEWEVLKAGKAR
ncbi:uncharacterized protein YaeQ [Trinickia symbiotica]|nr:uncharacterized protein YaeQ [Trinickia symbiotica]